MPLVSSITIAVIFITTLAFAQAMASDRYEFDDCILEHLKNAKLDAASRFIAEACEENYGSGPSRIITSKERSYNECLLEHMIGVESVDAVIRIRRACEKKYR